MNAYTVKCFGKAVIHGSKFVYQTVPRMLTIWLDIGEDNNMAQQDVFKKMTDDMSRTIKAAPVYKVCFFCCVEDVILYHQNY